MSKEEAKSKQKERQREYYLKHRDKMLAYSRKYIKDHPEKLRLFRLPECTLTLLNSSLRKSARPLTVRS